MFYHSYYIRSPSEARKIFPKKKIKWQGKVFMLVLLEQVSEVWRRPLPLGMLAPR